MTKTCPFDNPYFKIGFNDPCPICGVKGGNIFEIDEKCVTGLLGTKQRQPEKETNTMFQELYASLQTLGYKPYSYSGRSMYGKKCLAIVLDAADEMWSVAQALARDGIEIDAPKTDSFGRGVVIYWPSIKWEPVEASDED